MNNQLTCHDVQDQIQQALDQRSELMLKPEQQAHLLQCPECHLWTALFQYRKPGKEIAVPAQFAHRVLIRHRQEQTRLRWLRGSSLMAMAAAIVIGVMLWMSMKPNVIGDQSRSHELAKASAQETIDNWKLELSRIRNIPSRVISLNVALPESIYSWDLPEFDDSLTIALPAIRQVGSTIQSAVEPYEAPARAALQKVKTFVDDPELRKWFNTMKKRMT